MEKIKKVIVSLLAGFQGKERTKRYQLFSVFMGAVIFLVALPVLLICVGRWFDGDFVLRKMISSIAVVIGFVILLWAIYTQWRVGKGTPAPNAPTQQLVVTGPYQYTRNPMELGAIIYYFGLGSFFYSYTVGIVAFLLGLIIESAYYKFVEEKELERRFGQAYVDYRKRVPFLIPRFKTAS